MEINLPKQIGDRILTKWCSTCGQDTVNWCIGCSVGIGPNGTHDGWIPFIPMGLGLYKNKDE